MSYDIGMYLDYGREIGLGHLVRCAALARTARVQGCSTVLITSTAEEVPSFCGAAFDCVIRVPVKAKIDINDPQLSLTWLVVDHYNPSISVLARIDAAQILGLRDFPKQPMGFVHRILDTIPNQCARCLALDNYRLAGIPYLLLRSEFSEARYSTLFASKLFKQKKLDNVFISLGGGSQNAFLTDLARRLVQQKFNLTVVASSFSTQGHALTEIQGENCQVFSDQNASQIIQLIAKADLAICNAGLTAWEVTTLGLPTILIQMADNQTNNVNRLVAEGCSVFAGSAGDPDICDRVFDAVTKVSSSTDLYSILVKSAANLSDGLGCNRVLSWLFPCRDSMQNPVNLHPATLEDLELTYKWQCQPDTRAFARNTEIPSLATHTQWFVGKLKDPNCLFSIIHVAGSKAGVLRLDIIDRPKQLPSVLDGEKYSAKVYEISIYVANNFVKRGLASSALKAARCLLPNATIVAFVDQNNEASLRLFNRAGYGKFGSWFVAPPHGKPSQIE